MPVKGIDVAQFQSLALIESHLPTIEFGIVKLTEGVTFVNPAHAAQLRAFVESGKAVGVYHFLRHDESGRAQWRHFAEIAGPYRGQVFAAVDHERDESGRTPADKIARDFIAAGDRAGWKIGRYGSSGETMRIRLNEHWRWVAQWGERKPQPVWHIWQYKGGPGVDENSYYGTPNQFRVFVRKYASHRRPRVWRRLGGGGGRIRSL